MRTNRINDLYPVYSLSIHGINFYLLQLYLYCCKLDLYSLLWSRRSMDRTQLCGSCDVGSIPTGITL
jgi:hypothetical protein